jgi:hypothetical protein
MNGRKIWCALMALGLGLAAASATSDAHAQQKKTKTTTPAVAADPPVAKKTITYDLTGVTFGQSTKKVTEAIEKILDEDYKPLYAKVSPGVKMKQLDAALAEEKSAFARSVIKFDKIPVALDSGPLKGEYTYNNKEQKLDFTRKGVTFHFFFIQDKLWKIYAEHKLGEKEAAGKDFADAVSKLAKDLGIAGRVLAADANRSMQEVDWKDSTMHLRVVDRGSDKVAFVYEDNGTLASLSTLRVNKPAPVNDIDPAVAAITRKDPDPGPAPKADDRKGTTPAKPAPKK